MNRISENIWAEDAVGIEVEQFFSEWNSEKPYIIAQTSGSTGVPKEIRLNKKGLVLSARNTIQFFGLNENSKALLCLPLTTIGGKMMLVRAMESRMNLQVQKASSNPLLNFEKKLDFIAVTPMQLAQMMEESPKKLKGISSVLVGGAPMNETLIRQLVEEKLTVYHGYGMTETASHVALKKVGYQSDEYYRALPGINFEYGKNNTLKINYPAVSTKHIETNDVVELIDTETFQWLGRVDFIVNSGGIKIQVERVEQELSKIIQKPFFLFGKADKKLGEKLVLVIESDIIQMEFSFDFLGICKPREVYFLKQFCYNQSGKLDRRETIKLLKINS